jgi:hypothetical protein
MNKKLLLFLAVGFTSFLSLQLVEASQPLKRLALRKAGVHKLCYRNFSNKSKNDTFADLEVGGIVLGGFCGSVVGSVVGGGATLMLGSVTCWASNKVYFDSDEGQARLNIIKIGAGVGALTGSYSCMKYVMQLRPKVCNAGTACVAAIGAASLLLKK